MPPVAASVVLYRMFCEAFGKAVVVTDGGGTTEMLSDFVAVCEFESVTCTVKLVVPVPVGVPEICPVPGVRTSPAGRVPTETDHV